MAEHSADHGYDFSKPAEMDYPQHEATYELFLATFKWGAIFVIALMLGMAVGLVGSGGIFGGLFTFIVALVVAYVLAR
ncbi:aa3-type cytochrome c oxidase subunit IV [Mangrovibrevibacter kandeliae]|uniref:aa3-type cytochrome c oxidase subunit IV n=1 Tax=Mangrovibrevibacter kandeliae TaxID=2968473 RepID=UPI002119679C|nr:MULTISPECIES: aa3-type cytochrome c oxidase subunit IV [unclassified Aurantimonas]MCQ8780834.1 aa3-type cytochrome c oxidase subunit IV [Aurantimonas sp. CSK15Z-1]MCW4113614.1 aa3-type cytochrome c oxidase subunit IV [Aurantimonas sp. MSK8Z-1]